MGGQCGEKYYEKRSVILKACAEPKSGEQTAKSENRHSFTDWEDNWKNLGITG